MGLVFVGVGTYCTSMGKAPADWKNWHVFTGDGHAKMRLEQAHYRTIPMVSDPTVMETAYRL